MSDGRRHKGHSCAGASGHGGSQDRTRVVSAVMWGRHHDAMPFGVVDVGSNTVRLLVEVRGRPVLSERESLRLGADVERYGRITPEKLDLAAEVVGGYARDARAAGVRDVEVLITSPGRQAENGAELLERLEAA